MITISRSGTSLCSSSRSSHVVMRRTIVAAIRHRQLPSPQSPLLARRTATSVFAGSRPVTNESIIDVSKRHFASSTRLDQRSKSVDDTSKGASSSASGQKATIYNTVLRKPLKPYPQSPRRSVPSHILKPPYADTGIVPYNFLTTEQITIHDETSIQRMRKAARLARRTLDVACNVAEPGITTDEIDAIVHETIIANDAYPSPLNYAGFPKSLCSSINEVVCHGIPDKRPLQFGDVVSFDVSCYTKDGVHGDNCATVIVGDHGTPEDGLNAGVDWRGVPYLTKFDNPQDEEHFVEARRLVATTLESLYAGINTCGPGSCLSEVGAAIEQVAKRENYASVKKYRGHGVGTEFHTAPFVRHYANNEKLPLRPGMIFTIEPMLVQKRDEDDNDGDCFEWDDNWTVSTMDGVCLAAQFEHTILITKDGVEILTLPD